MVVKIMVDPEASSPDWWEAARASNAPDVVRSLLDPMGPDAVDVSTVDALEVLGWAKALPSWETGMDFAPHPLIFEGPRPSPGVEWHTPPVRQGQIVQVSYASDPEQECFWCRVVDRSDGESAYAVCPYAECGDVDWEPWNTDPEMSFVPVP